MTKTRVALGALIVIALLLVAVVILTNSSDNSSEAASVEETTASKLASLEPESGFNMQACLRTKVTVPHGQNGTKTISKTAAFCNAQAALVGRNVGNDLANTTAVSHHAENGAVVFHGWIGTTPVEQLRRLYRWALQDPVVAAMALGCYSHDTYNPAVLAKYRTAQQGSPEHLMAVRSLYAILVDPKTSFNNFKLYSKGLWNEGVTQNGTMTSSNSSFNGEPSTQVTTVPQVLPDGQAIPGGKSTQLHRCLNCQRQVPVGVITPSPGVIPPKGHVTKPVPTPPSGGGKVPPKSTEVIPQIPHEIPKHDTPANTPGPTGNGHPQPQSETEPPGTEAGNSTPPTEGGSEPYKPPPVPPAGEKSPETPSEGTVEKPTENW